LIVITATPSGSVSYVTSVYAGTAGVVVTSVRYDAARADGVHRCDVRN
jgi:hypothetical protein